MAARHYAQIEITQEEYDAVFASDDDSDSNLSFSDVNVDADLSDIKVQEFSEEESGESESEDSEAKVTSRPQVMNPNGQETCTLSTSNPFQVLMV